VKGEEMRRQEFENLFQSSCTLKVVDVEVSPEEQPCRVVVSSDDDFPIVGYYSGDEIRKPSETMHLRDLMGPSEAELEGLSAILDYASKKLNVTEFKAARVCSNPSCSRPLWLSRGPLWWACPQCGNVQYGDVPNHFEELPDRISIAGGVWIKNLKRLFELEESGHINVTIDRLYTYSQQSVLMRVSAAWTDGQIFGSGATNFRSIGNRETLAAHRCGDAFISNDDEGLTFYLWQRDYPGTGLNFIEKFGKQLMLDPKCDLEPNASNLARERHCFNKWVHMANVRSSFLAEWFPSRIPSRLTEIMSECAYNMYTDAYRMTGLRPVIARDGSVDWRFRDNRNAVNDAWIANYLAVWGAENDDIEAMGLNVKPLPHNKCWEPQQYATV
jgi:hypothetical protein